MNPAVPHLRVLSYYVDGDTGRYLGAYLNGVDITDAPRLALSEEDQVALADLAMSEPQDLLYPFGTIAVDPPPDDEP